MTNFQTFDPYKFGSHLFKCYGFLIGHVERVAADSVSDEKHGLVFPVSIKIDSVRLSREKAGGRNLAMSPGMSASMEIATGKRRIIDFTLSPVGFGSTKIISKSMYQINTKAY